MLKNSYLLLSIVCLAFVLRFYQLGNNPPSLNWDETAHGYNAYSILKTGRDEYGNKFPLSFRSFDDYKPPLYTYLVVSSVALFGLNDFAVRLPSAVLGVFAVFFTYLMVLELFRNKSIALLSAFFLAISPWHLQFSRVAFETNSATFWSVMGTWAFLKAINNQKSKITFWMSICALAFGANLFVYHNARVFIPMYSIMLIFLYRQKLLNVKKYLIIPTLITIFFIIILFPIITSISGQMRLKGTTVLGDLSPLYKASNYIAQDEKENQLLIGKLIHNRRIVYAPIILENYFSHFKPSFLFFTADMERHHAPQIGLLYLWDLVFLIIGIYYLIVSKFPLKTKIIIFWWFIIAPIASSVTWGGPHSLRSAIFLPTFQIFIAIGFYTLIQKTVFKKLFIFTASLLLFLNFIFYLHQYYVHMPLEYSKSWLFGRKQAVEFTENYKDKYEKVIVSTKIDQPHEFWLYYAKYNPVKYLAEGGTASGGFFESSNKFDKYLFRPINYELQKKQAKTLFVGVKEDLPSNVKILKQIHYLNSEPAIFIFE